MTNFHSGYWPGATGNKVVFISFNRIASPLVSASGVAATRLKLLIKIMALHVIDLTHIYL